MNKIKVIIGLIILSVIAYFWRPTFGPGTYGTGGNVVAEAVTLAVGWLFLGPIKSFWHKHFSVKKELEEVRKVTEAAHRVISDLHEAVTNERHPNSSPKEG